MSQVLYVKDNTAYDDVEASKWQATQVSAISIMSCTGRLAIGVFVFSRFSRVIECALTIYVSNHRFDLRLLQNSAWHSTFYVPHPCFLPVLHLSSVRNIKNLWIASSLLGFAYGNLFSLLATLCSEWFGMRKCSKVFLLLLSTYETFFLTAHFAENWGYIAMAPLLAGNLFSLMFGRNLDAHESASRGVSDAVDYHVALRMGKGAMGDSG
jgi:hypothetical protein